MASSILSPPTRIEREVTMPESEITATSVVPPPMSTTMFPVAAVTSRPAPIAAAIGSPIRETPPAPAAAPDGVGHRDDARLRADQPLAAHVDQRVGGAEIDREVAREAARELVEEHQALRPG